VPAAQTWNFRSAPVLPPVSSVRTQRSLHTKDIKGSYEIIPKNQLLHPSSTELKKMMKTPGRAPAARIPKEGMKLGEFPSLHQIMVEEFEAIDPKIKTYIMGSDADSAVVAAEYAFDANAVPRARPPPDYINASAELALLEDRDPKTQEIHRQIAGLKFELKRLDDDSREARIHEIATKRKIAEDGKIHKKAAIEVLRLIAPSGGPLWAKMNLELRALDAAHDADWLFNQGDPRAIYIAIKQYAVRTTMAKLRSDIGAQVNAIAAQTLYHTESTKKIRELIFLQNIYFPGEPIDQHYLGYFVDQFWKNEINSLYFEAAYATRDADAGNFDLFQAKIYTAQCALVSEPFKMNQVRRIMGDQRGRMAGTKEVVTSINQVKIGGGAAQERFSPQKEKNKGGRPPTPPSSIKPPQQFEKKKNLGPALKNDKSPSVNNKMVRDHKYCWGKMCRHHGAKEHPMKCEPVDGAIFCEECKRHHFPSSPHVESREYSSKKPAATPKKTKVRNVQSQEAQDKADEEEEFYLSLSFVLSARYEALECGLCTQDIIVKNDPFYLGQCTVIADDPRQQIMDLGDKPSAAATALRSVPSSLISYVRSSEYNHAQKIKNHRRRLLATRLALILFNSRSREAAFAASWSALEEPAPDSLLSSADLPRKQRRSRRHRCRTPRQQRARARFIGRQKSILAAIVLDSQ
jgi:hypothetical protein